VSWSYRKESELQSLPVPMPGAGWLSSFVAYLANLPLLGTILAILVLLVLGGIIAAAIILFVLLGPVPIPRELPSALVASSKIYDANGSLVATWHGPVNRQPVPLDQISPRLQQAVVAEEDARFYADPGVDLRSVVRAAIADFEAGKVLEGGSTLTQQYVKDAYVGNKPTLSRKILEARVALELTRKLTKGQIMDDYLNTAYFGDGAYGAEAAAETYFGVHASQLTVSQAALLAGIIHSPDNDSPIVHPAAAQVDRLRVIQRMEALGSISPVQAAQARAEVPALVTPAAADPTQAWFLDALRTSLLSQYGAGTVYGGGLQVHTTLDPAMESAAQASVQAALPAPSDPSSALVAVDPTTGYVKAIVGGKDYATSQFNVATMGRRQPGSAFKPFVLAAALEQGISPDAVYAGPSTLCLKGWDGGCVSNFGGESYGAISLLNATVNSVNTVYAQVMMQVGPANVVAIAHKMGIPGPADLLPPQVGCRPLGSPACATYLPAVPSIALGSAGVTPLEMASAYATLADNGVYHAPTLVSSVTNASGVVLAGGPSPGVQALPAAIAQEETQILSQVIVRGTGTAANIGQPAAGKTGTAQNFDNAWFVGYTPALAASVWVGDLNSNLPLLNVEGVPQMAGGTIPAKIWSNYMQVSLDTTPPTLVVGSGPANGTLTNQRSPAFKGTAADQTGNVERVEASIDGGAYAATGLTCAGCPGRSVSWTYTSPVPLADGAHTIAIRSVDIAGRDSAVETRTITVDTVAPKAAGLAARGGATALTATFSKPMLCSSVAPSAFRVVDGGRILAVTAVSCSGTADAVVGLTLAVPPRGGDQVSVEVLSSFRAGGGPTDQAGNAIVQPASASAVAANLAPTASVTGGMAPNALTDNAQPTYHGSAVDPDGNVSSVQASIDGGPFSSSGMSCGYCVGAGSGPLAAPVAWSWRAPEKLADGTHTLAFQSVDNAGTPSAVVTQMVTVDTVPPKVTALAATGGSAGVSMTFTKPMLCSSLAPADFQVLAGNRFAAVTSVTCTGTVNAAITLTLAVPPRGGDTLQVSVIAPYSGGPTDQAGNAVASPRSAGVTATNQPPSAAVTSGPPAPTPTSITHPSYQGTAVDPDGTVAGLQASIDGGPFAANGFSCSACVPGGGGSAVDAPVGWTWRSPLALADGTHTVAFRSIDNAGSTSPAVTESVTVDTVAPKPTGLAVTGGNATVTATFSKPLLCASVSPAGLSAVIANASVAVQSVSCAGTASATIAVTLGRAPLGGDPVAITAAGSVTDVAGNAVAPARVGATASNHPPTIALTGVVSAPVFTSDPRFSSTGNASDPDGAVARVEASVDGAPFSTGGVSCTGCSPGGAMAAPGAAAATWAYQSPRLADGSHTLAFQAVDNAGATSPAVTQTVIVNSRPPALKAVMASGESTIVSVIFSKPVMCSSVNVGELSVTVGGAPASIALITCSGASDAVVDLALTAAPAGGSVVQVTISRGIIDDVGNRLVTPASAGAPATSAPSDLP
jgi:penicillin-binding protein 1A